MKQGTVNKMPSDALSRAESKGRNFFAVYVYGYKDITVETKQGGVLRNAFLPIL